VADVDIAISAGTGTNIRAFQKASGDYDQYVRTVYGTTKATLSNIPWTVITAGQASVIPADVTRVGLIVTSAANGVVWVRFDSTVPTTVALSDWQLNPGDRWEVPHEFAQLAQSWAGVSAGGTVSAAGALCA
jgi:hypothetical protein